MGISIYCTKQITTDILVQNNSTLLVIFCKVHIKNYIWQIKLDNCFEIFTYDKFLLDNFENLMTRVDESSFYEKYSKCNADISENNSTFTFAVQYLNMALTMLSFISAVRSRNWELRLATLNEFQKYFFALDAVP